jgi:hypothetical protein
MERSRRDRKKCLFRTSGGIGSLKVSDYAPLKASSLPSREKSSGRSWGDATFLNEVWLASRPSPASPAPPGAPPPGGEANPMASNRSNPTLPLAGWDASRLGSPHPPHRNQKEKTSNNEPVPHGEHLPLSRVVSPSRQREDGGQTFHGQQNSAWESHSAMASSTKYPPSEHLNEGEPWEHQKTVSGWDGCPCPGGITRKHQKSRRSWRRRSLGRIQKRCLRSISIVKVQLLDHLVELVMSG